MRMSPSSPMPRRWRHKVRLVTLLFFVLSLINVPYFPTPQPVFAQGPSVTIVTPDDGATLFGNVTLRANVSDTTATSVEFFYDPHEDDEAEISLGLAAFNPVSGLWEMPWDTTAVLDTFNDIDTDSPLDGVEDTTVNLTKPPTNDGLRVVAVTGDGVF